MRLYVPDDPESLDSDGHRSLRAQTVQRVRYCAGVAVVSALCSTSAVAADECPGGAFGYVVTVQGVVEISAAGGGAWQAARLNTFVCMGDVIRVGEKSRAGIYFDDIETVTYVDQNTTTGVVARPAERSLILDLLEGAINFLSREPRSLEIRTPFVNAGVKGTEFEVRVDLDRPAAERPDEAFSGRTLVTLVEGRVEARVAQETKILVSGQSGEARGNCPSGISLDLLRGDPACVVPEGPQALRVYARLPDAVQWALYYPPITAGGPVALAPDLAEASRLLARGRVDEALPILCAGPAQGEKSALLAIVELTRNDPLRRPAMVDACGRPSERDNRQRALDLAEQAVRMSPHSAPAWVSLSYARQAYAKLEDARAALEQAVTADPNDALARARLAEIWLSLGYRDRALEEAERAKNLSPALSRTQTVYGFAALAEIDLDRARSAFTRAIEADSADPLPWLGRGLARIRDGDIAAGRRELEIAAGLDPQNSLIRSYLGKAYFEEKRGGLDAAQFDLAKKLDPLDPTPWVYDAIRLQTENRPVEALQSIQKSIELNDNRAVYRSQLQLDDDAAVRNTSLGRIYQDLGFEQLALVEGSKSLSYDPANYSAHRFLSDSYAGLPRYEIARSSELLQSQLLQPLNADPVQPQIAETDLNILTGVGPAEVGFNEFTPLFQHDGLNFNASAVLGNEETYGDEAVLSGIAGRTAFSFGQFHYQTDGFRPNNDIRHDIYNAFGQLQLTDDFDVQLEYRHRETEQGDRQLSFDSTFSLTDRREVTQDTPRIGAHYSPAPGNDVIASVLYTDREEQLQQALGPGETLFDTLRTKGVDTQIQYLFRSDPFNLTAGAGFYDIDFEERQIIIVPGPCPFLSCDSVIDSPIEQHNAYAYASVEWPTTAVWTFGLAYDSFEQGSFEVDDVNPKIGLQWNVLDTLRLRLAYFESLKRALIVDQTLEPTQVAGFNQFFDDFNGTRASQYGIGLDWELSDGLFVGAEASQRDLDVPIDFGGGLTFQEDQREDLYRGYVYWAFAKNLAAAGEVSFEGFQRSDLIASLVGIPNEIDTISVPVSIRYFGSSGILDGVFAQLGATFVHQELAFPAVLGMSSLDDDFLLVDALLGYRLPNRRGIVTLAVENLLDEDFRYQDVSFQTPRTPNPRFYPSRTVWLQASFSF